MIAHHRRPSFEAQAQESATREGCAERDWQSVAWCCVGEVGDEFLKREEKKLLAHL
jgi:hypothetical protein